MQTVHLNWLKFNVNCQGWQLHWLETWASDPSRLEISTLTQTWANRIQEMAGILV